MNRSARIFLFALLYIVAGKLGLQWAFLNASASPIWPATGLAIAALILFGFDLWPGILIGAFAVNLTTAGTVWTSLGIAIGNTLEAVAGAYLVNRFACGSDAFEHPYTIIKYAIVASGISTMLSATIGTSVLAMGEQIRSGTYGRVWLTWWMGDASGGMLFAPLLILCTKRAHVNWTRRQWLELAGIAIALILLGGMVFGGFFSASLRRYPLDFLCFPLIIWAAYRFGSREAAGTSVALSMVALWGTLHGFGPFARNSPNTSLLLLQSYMIVVALTGLIFSAVVAEHRREGEVLVQTYERRYRQLLESNIIGFIVVDWNGNVLEANGAFLRMVGYTRAEMLSGKIGGNSLTPEEYRGMDEWVRKKLKESGISPPMEKEYIRKDGTKIPVLVGVVLHKEPDEQLVCFVIDATDRRRALDALRKAYDELEIRVMQRTSELDTANRELRHEIERRKRAEAALQSLAITDPLTGLYNRRGFLPLATQLLKQARRSRRNFLMFMVDVDRLKEINDTYGHREGDQAVIGAAMLLKDTFRASDVIARLGGDEFAVAVIEDSSDNAVETLLRRLDDNIKIDNGTLKKGYRISLSAGASTLKPHESRSIEMLLAEADNHLYEQKRLKKAQKNA